MAVYLLTGRLGSGKSLGAVRNIIEYASTGRRVVTNFHVDLSSVCLNRKHRISRAVVEVIPDRPSSQDLAALGRGGPNEHEAGLLVLDECAVFLNARRWNGKDRDEFIDWFLHSRKLGWDVMLIVQHQSMLDKQIREAICEYLVVFKRSDKLRLPVVGWFLRVTLPRFHIGFVRYGLGPHDPIAERWIFRGNGWFEVYDTQWVSDQGKVAGRYSVPPATLSKWRYIEEVPTWKKVAAVVLLPFLWLGRAVTPGPRLRTV